MTIPRVMALSEYWKRNPPQHVLLAAQLGWKYEEPKRDPHELMEMFAAMGGKVSTVKQGEPHD
jgi:hypothetical protein